MLQQIFILAGSLYLVVKGATIAAKHAALLAKSFRLSKYTVGFIIVAVISILPEMFIVSNAAVKGIPEFGLGMLFGSNIADLTLIFAILIFVARRGIKVESKTLTNHKVYPFILLFPLLLGLDGYYSRIEGAVLILVGVLFYYVALRNGIDNTVPMRADVNRTRTVGVLLFSVALLLIGSHYTVTAASSIATYIGITPILIGMLIVGLGTTMPELFLSIQAVRRRDDSLAAGDILGTVLADATIVVGLLALINPFAFPQRIIFVTGAFMVVAAFLLLHYMRTKRVLSRREGYYLLSFWVVFVVVEFIANTAF